MLIYEYTVGLDAFEMYVRFSLGVIISGKNNSAGKDLPPSVWSIDTLKGHFHSKLNIYRY